MSDETEAKEIAKLPTTEIPFLSNTFEIDDNNYVDNGEHYFWLGDVKNLTKGHAQNDKNLGVIIVTFIGCQFGLPFADMAIRDEALAEMKRRVCAIKNGTIASYIAKRQKEVKKAVA